MQAVARRQARFRRGQFRHGPQPRLLAAPELQARLLDAVRGGAPLVHAAVYAGVTERTLHRTLRRGDDAEARADDGEQLNEDDRACLELYRRVKEARAQVAIRNLALVGQAAAGGYTVEEKVRTYTDESGRKVREVTTKTAPVEWRAALALLERSFPRDFARGAQQFEVITQRPDDGELDPERAVEGGAPSMPVLKALSSRLAAYTAQAAADDAGTVDAEVADDSEIYLHDGAG